jgi:hypothetical protein
MPALPDLILIAHFLIAAFIVGGLIFVWIGAWRKWRWIRNRPFRYLHLAAIGFVALEAIAGVACPLTVWEDQLRGGTGQDPASGVGVSFVARWVRWLLYYEAPEWIFGVAYVAWAAATLATLKLVPPKRTRD